MVIGILFSTTTWSDRPPTSFPFTRLIFTTTPLDTRCKDGWTDVGLMDGRSRMKRSNTIWTTPLLPFGQPPWFVAALVNRLVPWCNTWSNTLWTTPLLPFGQPLWFVAELVNRLVPWCAWLLSGALEIPRLRLRSGRLCAPPQVWRRWPERLLTLWPLIKGHYFVLLSCA